MAKETQCPICGAEWPKNLRKSFRRLEMECPICYAGKQRRMDWAAAKATAATEAAMAVHTAEMAKLTPPELRAIAEQDKKDLWGD